MRPLKPDTQAYSAAASPADTERPAGQTTRCPLCGQDNQCHIANGLPAQDCWCMTRPVSPTARARAGDSTRCICAQCGIAQTR